MMRVQFALDFLNRLMFVEGLKDPCGFAGPVGAAGAMHKDRLVIGVPHDLKAPSLVRIPP